MFEMDFEKEIIPYIDTLENLFTSEFWGNLLLDCTKNELFVLWLLYKKKEVNMTQVAEYIHVPLNTATGIIARMEKRKLVSRQRSDEDKRVVTITFGEDGQKQIYDIIKQMTYYAGKVFAAFTPEEMQLLVRMADKLIEIMKEEKAKEQAKPQIRKIEIL